MKKLLCVLFCLALLCSAATAEGLSGLTDNAGGLSGLLGQISEPLPDPADILGTSGTLIRENYSFAEDLLCNAYTYARPGSEEAVSAFLSQYAQQAAQCGYSVTETTVEGTAAYRMEHPTSGNYALLLPDFNGQMLLLVDVDLEFGAAGGAPATVSTPEVLEDYVEYTLDGRTERLYLSDSVSHDLNDESFNFNFFGDRTMIDYFKLSIPNYVRSGDTYHSDSKSRAPGVRLYLKGVLPNPPEFNFWVSPDMVGDKGYDAIRWRSTKDYFDLSIDSMVEDDKTVVFEATFSGVFNDGKVTLENGKLRATVYK